MKTAEIRSKFLKFFESKKHTIVESSSLVPANDPTLLFANAGMNQFKDVFTGKEKRPYSRATTSQKCVRAGGKHNDLENVGFTARHHTFFEMLGNFSFGDYFKRDAIAFAWEFVTKELKLPKDRLYVSVFRDDDEAAEIWHKEQGVPKERIFRFGEKDNFWAMGDTGPCGPCTEIFYDRGDKNGVPAKLATAEQVENDGERFMEFWNLVFMQFERHADGKMVPLPKPSVDTGAGLERLASILQNVSTNYDIDLFQEIIQGTAKLAGKAYDKDDDLAVSFRVIADHSRATAFLIADGVLPANEGRGYVLRRIMRRAIRHGRKLGFDGPFLHKTAGLVVDAMSSQYPDLKSKRSFIEKAVIAEEEQFLKTLDRGIALLDEEAAKLKKSGPKGNQLSGDIAFKLYDTYGFPLDLTRVILEERGMSVDEAGFETAMEKQRSESRKHWKGSGEEAVDDTYIRLADTLRQKNKLPIFMGYETLEAKGECLWTREVSGGVIEAVFDRTPFYGESGGQVGDRGLVRGEGFEAEVITVAKPTQDLIVAKLKPIRGKLQVGHKYDQQTAADTRALTARNHTATHMLQWALRQVLGDHVKQAGSLVTDELLRFDFTHFNALTAEEIQKIEDLVNAKIWSASPVAKEEMTKDQAVAKGAIAFFGDKYGERVRVISVGDFSIEFCGGTHVDNSSDIHMLKIASESGIAAGVRRIIAYTSKGAFQYLRDQDQTLKILRDKLKASAVTELETKIDKLFSTEKELRKQIEQLQSKSAAGEVDELIQKAKNVNGVKLVTGICAPDSSGVKRLREIADQVKQKAPDVFLVLGIQADDKVFVLAAAGPKMPKPVKANDVIQKIAPHIDGRGGGKPDLAQAGGAKLSGLSAALQAVEGEL